MARFNEWYPTGPMVAPGAVSMTKVKNLLKKSGRYYATKMMNTRVNGQLRGCFGFIRRSGDDKPIYIDTEYSPFLIRFARDENDYCGETNEYCQFDTLIQTLDAMFSRLDRHKARGAE